MLPSSATEKKLTRNLVMNCHSRYNPDDSMLSLLDTSTAFSAMPDISPRNLDYQLPLSPHLFRKVEENWL